MRPAIFVFLVFISLLTSSCLVRTNRLSFKSDMPLVSEHTDFNKDSLHFLFLIEAKKRSVSVPFFIFLGDKKKFRITYQLCGKGISAREYTIAFGKLVVKNDTQVVARSKDPYLFKDQKETTEPCNLVSPFYTTDYLATFHKPRQMKLTLELEIEVRHKDGTREKFNIDTPLEKIITRGSSLFTPFN